MLLPDLVGEAQTNSSCPPLSGPPSSARWWIVS